jgi:hypothetical protein
MNKYLSQRLESTKKRCDYRIQRDELRARLLVLAEKIKNKNLQNKYMRMIITGEIHDAEFNDDSLTFCFIKNPCYW